MRALGVSAALLLLMLVTPSCESSSERVDSTPEEGLSTAPVPPREQFVGSWRGNFDAVAEEGGRQWEVPLVVTVEASGTVSGSWDFSPSAEASVPTGSTSPDSSESTRTVGRLRGEFEGIFFSGKEYVGQGTATQTVAPPGDPLALGGDFQVRGLLSDDGLMLGTIFLGDRRIMFQSVYFGRQ